MEIVFLGTSAGVPTKSRNVTSHAIRFDSGSTWLLDCGEATQHQIRKSSIRPSKIDRILITHLHGDHWYGLPGLLCDIDNSGRSAAIEIIGPQGIRECMQNILAVSQADLSYEIEWIEVKNNTDFGPRPNTVKQLSARTLQHRIASFAYIIQEENRPGRFQIEKVNAKGITESKDISSLAKGEKIEINGQVLDGNTFRDPEKKGRTIALLGDTCQSASLISMNIPFDWVVHECTFGDELMEKAKSLGHSSPTMIAEFLKKTGTKNAILTHFSARYTAPESQISVDDLRNQVAEKCPGVNIFVANDLDRFELI